METTKKEPCIWITGVEKNQTQVSYTNVARFRENIVNKINEQIFELDLSTGTAYTYHGIYRNQEGAKKIVPYCCWSTTDLGKISRSIRNRSIYFCEEKDMEGISFFQNIFGRKYLTPERNMEACNDKTQSIFKKESNILDENYEPSFLENQKLLIAQIMSRLQSLPSDQKLVITNSKDQLKILENIYLLLPEQLRNQTSFSTNCTSENWGPKVICTKKETTHQKNCELFDIEKQETYSYDEQSIQTYLELMKIEPILLQKFLAFEEKIELLLGAPYPSFKNQKRIIIRVLEDYKTYLNNKKSFSWNIEERLQTTVLQDFESYLKSKTNLEPTKNFPELGFLEQIENNSTIPFTEKDKLILYLKDPAKKAEAERLYQLYSNIRQQSLKDNYELNNLLRKSGIIIKNNSYNHKETLETIIANNKQKKEKMDTLEQTGTLDLAFFELFKEEINKDKNLSLLVQEYKNMGILQMLKKKKVASEIKEALKKVMLQCDVNDICYKIMKQKGFPKPSLDVYQEIYQELNKQFSNYIEQLEQLKEEAIKHEQKKQKSQTEENKIKGKISEICSITTFTQFMQSQKNFNQDSQPLEENTDLKLKIWSLAKQLQSQYPLASLNSTIIKKAK